MPPASPPALPYPADPAWTPRQGPPRQLPPLEPLDRGMAHRFPELEAGPGITLCAGRVLYAAHVRASATACLALFIEAAAFRSPEHRATFMEGLNAVQRFQHPHVLSLLWMGEREGCVCLGYEAFDGQSLLSLMNHYTMLPPLVVNITGALGNALHQGQQQGIIHRDLGPPGILVNRAGFAKIAGMGLSPLLLESDKAYLDSVLRRPEFLRAWMAPELMNLSAPGDYSADIYSLGAITYDMLVGNPPSGFAMPPSSRASVGTFIDQAVFRALHSNRESRYQSAAVFGTDMQSLYSAHNNAHLLAKKAELVRGPVRFQKKKTASLLAAGLVAAGGAGYLAWRYLGPFGSDAVKGADHRAEDARSDAILRKLAMAMEKSGKGMNKAQKEFMAAMVAATIQDILQLTKGSRRTETGMMAANLMMQGGEEEDALKMLEKLQGQEVPESIDWKRVNALTQLLRVTRSGYHTAMAAADEAARAGDAKKERSALARASGYLAQRRDLRNRSVINNYDPIPALTQVLKKMPNGAGGEPVKYAIRARMLELQVDLAGNTELADLTPLSQFPITHLDISDTRVADLTPLSLAPLQVLRADRTPVTLLAPVIKGPIRLLTAEGGAVMDDGSLEHAQILTNYRVTMRGGTLAKKESTASWGQTWVNSVGMTFLPVAGHSRILVSRDETLVRHFLAAREARESNHTPPLGLPHPVATPGPVRPSPLDPVTSITVADASAFCYWLTERERSTGNISVRASYRLPANHEWNQTAGYVSHGIAGKSPLTSSSPLYTIRSNLPASGPLSWMNCATADIRVPGTFRSPAGIHGLDNGIQEWCQDSSPSSTPGLRDQPSEWVFWNGEMGNAFFPSPEITRAPTAGQADVGFRIALELPPIPW